MNRFLAHPSLVGGAFLSVLGCTSATPAVAATDPKPPVPAICRQTSHWGDWYTAQLCREAWQAMYGTPHPRKQNHDTARRADRTLPSPAPTPHRPPPPRPDQPTPRRSSATPRSSPVSTPPPSARQPKTQTHAEEPATHLNPLQPLLLLGSLLLATAAIGYPFRRRIYALAGTAFLAPAHPITDNEPTAHFTYRPAIDPFAVPALGLTGPGATDTARVIALAALEDDALVVIPRADAITVFGLAEDELLEETTTGLFIPGNLDAALASIETELAVRAGGSDRPAPRLLLVADCEKEHERIQSLLTRRPGDASAVLLGDWAGDQATIDENGLVTAPPTLGLPERLPAMSRTEARDRLYAAIAPRPTKRRRYRRNPIP